MKFVGKFVRKFKFIIPQLSYFSFVDEEKTKL